MRILNRVLAAILGLALLAGGLLVAIEIALGLLDRDPWVIPRDVWYQQFRLSDWMASWVRTMFALLCLAGGFLVALQLSRRGPQTLSLRSPEQWARAEVGRLSLQKSLARTAKSVDGIAEAKATVGTRRVVVAARTSRRDPGDLEVRVAQAVGAQLEAMQLAKQARVSVRVQPRRSREGH